MKKILLLFFLLIISFNLFSQQLSARKAMLYSAILPGLGEIYTKNPTKAGFFLGAEFAILFSYFRFKSETEWKIDSYEQFAFANAGIPENSSDDLYQDAQDYISSEEYNARIILAARNYFLIYYHDEEAYQEYLNLHLIPEDEGWDWETGKNWSKFKKLRRQKQDLEICANFAVAGLILNRLVSVLDSAISAKKYNKQNKYYGKLTVAPVWENKGLKIGYEYKF